MISNGHIDRRIGPQSLSEKIKENAGFPILLVSASAILSIFIAFVELWFGSSLWTAIVKGHVLFLIFNALHTAERLRARGWNWIECFISVFLSALIFLVSLFFITPLLLLYISASATIPPGSAMIIPVAP